MERTPHWTSSLPARPDDHRRTLRVAVVGAGRFGQLHVQKLAGLPGVQVVAVADPDLDRARHLAAQVGAQPCASVHDLPAVDAATVVVPLDALASVAGALLTRGVHVLVEKPLAATAAEARALVALAERADRLLAVGYLERFNAALAGFRAGARLVARRVGPRAVGPLALDWLVHDLDLTRFFLGGDLEVVAVRQGVDHVWLRLVGPSGEARVFAREGLSGVRRHLWGAGGRVDLRSGGDALRLELAAFCAAVRGAPSGALALGADGLAALVQVEAAQVLSGGASPRHSASLVAR